MAKCGAIMEAGLVDLADSQKHGGATWTGNMSWPWPAVPGLPLCRSGCDTAGLFLYLVTTNGSSVIPKHRITPVVQSQGTENMSLVWCQLQRERERETISKKFNPLGMGD